MNKTTHQDRLDIHQIMADDAQDALLRDLREARTHLDSAMDHALWIPNNNGLRERIARLSREITDIRITLFREEA